MKRRIVWFASSGDVAQMGPFKSEVDAWAHIRLTTEEMERNGSCRPFSDDAIVWCENANSHTGGAAVKKHWTDKLSAFKPCSGRLAWARGFPTAQAAWDACENPDWMCWLLEKTGADRRDLTLLACQFARLALPYAKGDEAELAIATAEQWAHGDEEVTEEDVRIAAADASAAASRAAWSVAGWASAYASMAAYAACAAADGLAAWSVAGWASAYASMAVYAACADADASAARADTPRKCCHIIRRFYPEVPL